MRTDCIKFNEVIDMEVKNYGLDDIISISKRRSIGNNRSLGFTQITIRENGSLYAGLDIFPCDYIINPTEDTEKQFKKAKKDYFKNLDDGMEKQEVIDIFMMNWDAAMTNRNSSCQALKEKPEQKHTL